MPDSFYRKPTTHRAVSIKVAHNLDEISRIGAAEITHQLKQAEPPSSFFSIALSGGSTPGGLYARLAAASSVADPISRNDLHFFWSDERHVPPDHPQSNYRMAAGTLFNAASVPTRNIHRVHSENADAATAAEDYERELISFFNLAPGDFPRFDCMLLGIGADGHTASLFPVTPALRETKRLVVANWVEKLEVHRITMTVPVLNNAALVIVLVSGKEKAEVLKEILEGDYRPDVLPAQLIRPVHGRLLWLVDQAAAGCLTESIKV